MFSGIIETTAKLLTITKKRAGYQMIVTISTYNHNWQLGESIAIDGVCLTIKDVKEEKIYLDLSEETYRNTRFHLLKSGAVLNLERSLKFGDRVCGHWVYGHVDTIGQISALKRKAQYLEFSIHIAKQFLIYVVPKGSIAINGVSLTIQKITKGDLSFIVIPYTFKNTNLAYLKNGEKVNVEFDPLAKYIVNYLKNVKVAKDLHRDKWL